MHCSLIIWCKCVVCVVIFVIVILHKGQIVFFLVLMLLLIKFLRQLPQNKWLQLSKQNSVVSSTSIQIQHSLYFSSSLLIFIKSQVTLIGGGGGGV